MGNHNDELELTLDQNSQWEDCLQQPYYSKFHSIMHTLTMPYSFTWTRFRLEGRLLHPLIGATTTGRHIIRWRNSTIRCWTGSYITIVGCRVFSIYLTRSLMDSMHPIGITLMVVLAPRLRPIGYGHMMLWHRSAMAVRMWRIVRLAKPVMASLAKLAARLAISHRMALLVVTVRTHIYI